MTTLVHIALVLTGAAAFLVVLTWLILTHPAPAVEATPQAHDTAVETPEAGEDFPPTSPTSGAPPTITAYCTACRGLVHLPGRSGLLEHATEAQRQQADIEAWEREVSQ